MIWTILGCGGSTGVPVIGCTCSVCKSDEKKNTRLRSSVWIQIDKKDLVIDLSPDFRFQALRAKIPKIDAILFTHPHADHLHGIDDVKPFNFIRKAPIPAYGHAWTLNEIQERFHYIFKAPTSAAGSLPQLELHELTPPVQSFEFENISITAFEVHHGKQRTLGYKIRNIAYVTDCHLIPPTALNELQNLEVLIIDCLRYTEHPTHFTMQQALETIQHVKPKKAVLTHLSHEIDAIQDRHRLPENVYFAYDGLQIQHSNVTTIC